MNLFTILLSGILFFLLYLPITVFAYSSPSLLSNNRYSVGLNLGVAHPTNIGNTTFPLGYSTFSYSSNTNDLDTLISGISVSKILPLTPLYTLQVGFEANSLSSMKVKGDLKQGISPPFYQANYAYRIKSYQFLADAKFRRQFCNRYFPYVYLGLGIASNRAYNYTTTVPDYLTVTPEYSSNTTNSFSYSLGLGMDYFVMPKVSVGLGYRFINLGKVGLGPGIIRNTNVSAKLTQSHLYMNSLLAQLNYFI